MLRFIPINKEQAVGKITISHESKLITRPRSLIYALDISGSMAGRPLDNAKAGLIAALRDQINNFNEITVVIYNDTAVQKNVTKDNLNSVIFDIELLRARSCTNFSELFIGLDNIVKRQIQIYNGNVDIYIYIFSDGKHYEGIQQAWTYTGLQPTPAQQLAYEQDLVNSTQRMIVNRTQFSNTLKNNKLIQAGGRTFCKARAFSNDVDVPMMEYLTHCGTNDGDFLYAFTAQDIIQILSVDELLNANVLNAKLVFDNNTELNISFSPISDSSKLQQESSLDSKEDSKEKSPYEAQVIITLEQLAKGLPSLLLDGKLTKLKSEMVTEDAVNSSEIFDAFLFNFATRMKQLADKLIQNGNDKNSIDISVNNLKTLDNEMTKFFESKYPLLKSRIARKKYGALYNQLRQELATITANAVTLVRGSAPEALARILHAGHQANKKGLQNRLNTLALAGASKLEESEKKLIELANIQDKKDIIEKLESCPISCMISLSNASDAVLDQDIICLTGYMSRSEAAIGSSDQIRIQNINSMDNSILWSVFCEELLSKLSTLNYDDKAKAVHGGFDMKHRAVNKDTTGVMSNAYRSALNFAYPLYINQHHWDVAKHYIRQIVAWMSTLDFAAQTFDQIKNVPFVLVGSAILDLIQNPTETNVQAFLNVSRVAKQIIVDYNLKHITEDYDNWEKGYEGRVPKNISSIFVFLTKLLFVDKENLNLTDSFWQSVFEEQSRRLMQKQNTPLISETFVAEQCNYFNYLQINQANQIDELKYARLADPDAKVESKDVYTPPVFARENVVTSDDKIDSLLDKFVQKYQNLHHMIVCMKKFYQFVEHVDMNTIFDEFDKNLGVVDENIMKHFVKLNEMCRVNQLDLQQAQQSQDNKVKYTIDSLTMEYNLTKEQIYGMLVMNQRHQDNNTRAESKLLPVSMRDTTELLKSEVERSIQTEQTKQNASIQADYNKQLAKLFLTTDDLNVAQGIILSACHNVGSPLFHILLVEMEELKHSPYRLEKLNMLVSGKHNNRQLYRAGYVYPANKRNRGRLIYAYNWDMMQQQLEMPSNDFWTTVFKYAGSNKI